MTVLSAADRRVVFPGSAKPVGPYSPGIFSGDYLYISGQGARDAKGVLPSNVEDQTRNCMENIKTIVEAAGLTMENIVYTHTYLTDFKNYAAMNKVYATYFPGLLPARSTMGVARMPVETPVEISAIAIRDKTARQPVTLPNAVSPVPISPGILTPDRFYISGILGRDAEKNITPETGTAQIAMCLSRMTRVLTAAKLPAANLLHLNVYRTADLSRDEVLRAMHKAFPDVAISLIEASALPFGVKVGITGIATRDLKEKRTYKSAGETVCASDKSAVYCAAIAAPDIPEATAKIQAGLKALGSEVARAVANNVYLANIDDFAKMNAGYAASFPAPPPSRTTVQPTAAKAPFVQLTVVAAR
jgi:2-iminobutanoate/2-iminopropanoate deaminase